MSPAAGSRSASSINGIGGGASAALQAAIRSSSLERLYKEVRRRADVVGIILNEDSITRLIGAVLLEQNDEYKL